MRKRKITISNDTFASNPGEINFKPLVWLRHNPVKPTLLFLAAAITLYASLRLSFLYLLFFVPIFFINAFYWIRKKEHFTADSNGGLVISTHPTLVAVWTDLSKGFGYYPVLKVFRYRPSKPVTVGDRIATVAVYSQHDENDNEFPYWADFHPLPADYATNNKTEIDAALQTYTEEQWRLTDEGVKELTQPYKPGLYRVEQNTSDWQSVDCGTSEAGLSEACRRS